MNPVTDQAATMGRSQVEMALRLAEITAEGLEKLLGLQVQAVRGAVADGIHNIRQVASAKDVSELSGLTSGWAQPAWEKAQAYAKGAYETVATSQAEVSSLLEQQFAELNKNIVVALDTALKSAPAGSEALVAGFKSALQSTNAVYESVLKASKQVSASAEANLAALTPTGTKKKAA